MNDYYLPLFSTNLGIFNKWIEPEILAEHVAYVLVGEPGESSFEISIRKYDTRITGMNQIYIKLVKNEFA